MNVPLVGYTLLASQFSPLGVLWAGTVSLERHCEIAKLHEVVFVEGRKSEGKTSYTFQIPAGADCIAHFMITFDTVGYPKTEFSRTGTPGTYEEAIMALGRLTFVLSSYLNYTTQAA